MSGRRKRSACKHWGQGQQYEDGGRRAWAAALVCCLVLPVGNTPDAPVGLDLLVKRAAVLFLLSPLHDHEVGREAPGL